MSDCRFKLQWSRSGNAEPTKDYAIIITTWHWWCFTWESTWTWRRMASMHNWWYQLDHISLDINNRESTSIQSSSLESQTSKRKYKSRSYSRCNNNCLPNFQAINSRMNIYWVCTKYSQKPHVNFINYTCNMSH